jgi:hypothetical protein
MDEWQEPHDSILHHILSLFDQGATSVSIASLLPPGATDDQQRIVGMCLRDLARDGAIVVPQHEPPDQFPFPTAVISVTASGRFRAQLRHRPSS